jgi:hypothetical protein
MGDIGACVAAMEQFALGKWVETEAAIGGDFCPNAEDQMRGAAPEETGNLKSQIEAKYKSTGVMSGIVTTEIGSSPHPINGVPASTYGFYQNDGFINKRSKQYIPGKHFMEESETAYAEFLATLSTIWG